MLYLGPGTQATFNTITQTPISEESKDRGAVSCSSVDKGLFTYIRRQ